MIHNILIYVYFHSAHMPCFYNTMYLTDITDAIKKYIPTSQILYSLKELFVEIVCTC